VRTGRLAHPLPASTARSRAPALQVRGRAVCLALIACCGFVGSCSPNGCPGGPEAGPTGAAMDCPDSVFRAGGELAGREVAGALALLPPAGLCRRGQLVRALALIAAERTAEAREQLAQVIAAAGTDRRAAVLAEELLAVELSAAQGPAGAAEALAAAERALQLDPRTPRARLLRAMLRATTDRDEALKDIVALAAARVPWIDPGDLHQKDLAEWLLWILADSAPLPPSASPVAHEEVAKLLAALAARRTGARQRQLTSWALVEIAAAMSDPPRREEDRQVEIAARLHRIQMDFPGEIELLQSYLRRFPDRPRLRERLLEAYNRVGRYQEAIELGAGPLEQCPRCALALAEAHFRRGSYLPALMLLRKLREGLPEDPDVLSLLGRCLLQQGQLEEGVTQLLLSLQRRADDLPTLLALGGGLSQLGRTAEAQEVNARYLTVHTAFEQQVRREEAANHASSTYADAIDHLARGDRARATELARFVGERDPRFALLPLLRLALALAAQQPPARTDAEELLEAALARNPWFLADGR